MKKESKLLDSSLLVKTAARFKQVLITVKQDGEEKLAVVFSENDPTLVKGALTTSIMFLDRFVEMFSDLIKKNDYRISKWKERYAVNEKVFENWQRMGLLHDNLKSLLFVLVYEKLSCLVKVIVMSENLVGLSFGEIQKNRAAIINRYRGLKKQFPKPYYEIIIGGKIASVSALQNSFSHLHGWDQAVQEKLK